MVVAAVAVVDRLFLHGIVGFSCIYKNFVIKKNVLMLKLSFYFLKMPMC